MKDVVTRVKYFYVKFQALLMSFFVIGIVELAVYSDLFMASMALPEVLPFLILISVAYGIYKKIRGSKRTN